MLPFDSNGLPVTGSYPATSIDKIQQYFEKGIRASNAYAIMAQPCKEGSPTFCLFLFGTANKFKEDHVSKR